jgi:hypothetical protein
MDMAVDSSILVNIFSGAGQVMRGVWGAHGFRSAD